MNDAWRLAPWADVLYACDGRWWDAKRPLEGQTSPRLQVSQDQDACVRYGLTYVASMGGAGLCRTPGVLHQGLNSGYQAMNLAYHLGATRMALLGYDMQRTGGRSHWFGDHPAGLQVPSPYLEFAARFPALADDLRSEGVQVINCSRETALACFPRATIQSILGDAQ